MDQLSAMRVFIRVVEMGNFTRAAQTLNMPKTSVTNMVRGLETHLKTTLLNRTTRRVMLTNDGALYFERANQILSELDELDTSLSSSHSQASGRLRVEMSGAFADRVILPSLCDFHTRYPQIKLDIGIGDRLVDYVAESVDCAIRAGTPTDPTLVARKVGEIRIHTYAAPTYIRRVGLPERPEDLLGDRHLAVAYLNAHTGQIVPMEFLDAAGDIISVAPNYVVSMNDVRTYMAAAIDGMGLAQLPLFMVRDAVARGDLVQALPGWQCAPMPVYTVYPQKRHVSNKVRVFIDWVAKLMQTLKAEELAAETLLLERQAA